MKEPPLHAEIPKRVVLVPPAGIRQPLVAKIAEKETDESHTALPSSALVVTKPKRRYPPSDGVFALRSSFKVELRFLQ